MSKSPAEMMQDWMTMWMSAVRDAGNFQLPPAKERMTPAQADFFAAQAALWQRAMAGGVQRADAGSADRRFASASWREHPYYSYLMESYLLTARHVEALAEAAPVEGQEKDRLRFAARQWVDALCPANFASTNPEVIHKAIESRGESITRGVANLVADMAKGRISQTDEAAFELGRDLATTPGQVMFENRLMQLIQYRPLTASIAKRPLVIVPPCINKFYILDLQPENSFVRHALQAGQAVFMVSWKNPGAAEAQLGWDDYLQDGVIAALEAARAIAGADRVNALGFCVGGTLLGASLALLAGRGAVLPASVTYLAAMHDFADTGEISLFVDPASVAAREAAIGAGGLLTANELGGVFSALRANDLVWPYVVNNYLMGKQPAAFDLLHWNSDGTNLPGPMYCYYLRNMYLENRLKDPGALSAAGVPLDLSAVSVPTYILATREDHIVPWRTAYRSLRTFGGDNKVFVLGASGHVAGIVNPPAKGRRSYWTGAGAAGYPLDPDAWLSGAREEKGSWWPHWSAWLDQHSGGQRKAPARAGKGKYKVIEPAPGRYVKEKAPGNLSGITAPAG